MRVILFAFVFIGVFFGLYFTISFFCIPIFGSFFDIVSNKDWFFAYSILIGWWVGLMGAMSLDEEIYS